MRGAIDHHRDRAVSLFTFVRLDPLRHLIFVIDLDVLDAVTLNPALAVNQVVIVLDSWAYSDAIDLCCIGAVTGPADHHFLLFRRRGAGALQRGYRARTDSDRYSM